MAMTDEQWAVRTGAAALVTCIVRTLQQSDPTFEERFLKNLDEAHHAESVVETLAKRLDELPGLEEAAEPEENVPKTPRAATKTPPQHRLKPKRKKTPVPKKRKARKSQVK